MKTKVFLEVALQKDELNLIKQNMLTHNKVSSVDAGSSVINVTLTDKTNLDETMDEVMDLGGKIISHWEECE